MVCVLKVLGSPWARVLLRAHRVGRDRFLDYLALEISTVDKHTGVWAMSSHATLAHVLGCSVSTIRRCRIITEELGLARTVWQGRYLTRTERLAALHHSGVHILHLASVRRLTTPTRENRYTEHLLRSSHLSLVLSSEFVVPERVWRRVGAAARPRAPTTAGPPRAGRPPLGVQHLAAHLIRLFPSLRGTHPYQVCRALMTLGISEDTWTAHDIGDALWYRNHSLGLYQPARARNPIGLFVTQMRDILSATTEAPVARRHREAVERAEQARERADAQRRDAELRAAHEADPDWAARQAAAYEAARLAAVGPRPVHPVPILHRAPRPRSEPDEAAQQADHDRFMAHIAGIIAQDRARRPAPDTPPTPDSPPAPGHPTRVQAMLAARDARIEAMLTARRAAEDQARAREQTGTPGDPPVQ